MEPVEIEPNPLGRDGDLYNHAPAGLISTARDGSIIGVNETFLSLTGYRRRDLLDGRRLQDVMAPGGKALYTTHLEPVLLLRGRLSGVLIELQRADGSRVPTLVHAEVRNAATNETTTIEFALLDTTARQGYERALADARRRAERLQRISAAFVSSLDVDQIAQEALAETVDGVKADYGAIIDAEEGQPHLVLDRALHETLTASARTKEALLGHTAVSSVMSGSGPVYAQDVTTTADSAWPDADCRRVAYLPLETASGPVGTLVLASHSSSSFDDDERSFLETFARVCGQAIERARLHAVVSTTADRFRFLAQVNSALENELSLHGRAERLLELLVPSHADFATIEIPTLGLAPVAARHRDPEMLEPLIKLRTNAAVGPELPHSMARGLARREPQMVSRIPTEMYEQYELGSEDLELLRLLAPTSYLGIPLLAREQPIGSLMLSMSSSGRRFVADQMPFYADVGARAALSLDNARLYEDEQRLAGRLQRSLLPPDLPEDERYAVHALYRASTRNLQVGGDWYDAFRVGDGKLAVAIGDVVGHGLDAALAMGQLRIALRAFASTDAGPEVVRSKMSRFAATIPRAQYTTLLYGELDIVNRTFSFVRAGHMPVLLLSDRASASPIWGGGSPPLCVDPDGDLTSATIEVASGETLVLFTDGLVPRGEVLDHAIGRIARTMTELWPTTPTGNLERIVADLVPAVDQDDDICMLTVTLA